MFRKKKLLVPISIDPTTSTSVVPAPVIENTVTSITFVQNSVTSMTSVPVIKNQVTFASVKSSETAKPVVIDQPFKPKDLKYNFP